MSHVLLRRSSGKSFRGRAWTCNVFFSISLLFCRRVHCPIRFQQGTSVTDWLLPQYLLQSFLMLALTSAPALEAGDLSSSQRTSLLTHLSAGHKLLCQCFRHPCHCFNLQHNSTSPHCLQYLWILHLLRLLHQKPRSLASVNLQLSPTQLLLRWPTMPLPPPSARARTLSWQHSSQVQGCLVTWLSRLLSCRGSPGPSSSPSWHLHSPKLFLWPVLGQGPNSHKK